MPSLIHAAVSRCAPWAGMAPALLAAVLAWGWAAPAGAQESPPPPPAAASEAQAPDSRQELLEDPQEEGYTSPFLLRMEREFQRRRRLELDGPESGLAPGSRGLEREPWKPGGEPWKPRRQPAYPEPDDRRAPAPEPEPPASPEPDLSTQKASPDGAFQVGYTSLSEPNSSGLPQRWQVRITDANGMPVNGAVLQVEAIRPDGSELFSAGRLSVRELGGGRYRIRGLTFDRPGLWKVVLTVGARGDVQRLVFRLRVP